MIYRRDIDGLRTIAVMLVIVSHAGLGLPGGFVGVDVFFVISGFLITHLLIVEINDQKFSIWRFYERRIRRLFPALFVVLAVTTGIASFVMVSFDLEDYAKSLVSTTLFAGNLWFFRQEGYFTEAAELEPLLHTWSLGVEEQYYIFFPVLLVLLFRVTCARRVFAAVFLLALGSFLAAAVTVGVALEAAFYLPHLRAWELLMGSLLAMAIWQGWWKSSRLPLWITQLLAIIGFAAIFWPAICYSSETPFPGLAALPPCLGAATLIAIGDHSRSLITRFLSLAPMVFVGKLSYSLYLWHWPLISLAYYQFGALTPQMGIICVLLSFALSYVSWRYVEKPMRNRKRVGSRMIVAASAGVFAASIGIGSTIWKLDGFPNRTNPELLALANPLNFLHDRRDCHFVTAMRASANDVCIRGADASTPSFILTGDSHADAFSPAIFTAAADLGLSGYQFTDSGFVPLPLPEVWLLGRARSDTSEALIAFIEARPWIETLIVTRYWLHQMTGYTYRHNGDVWVDEDYEGSGTSYNATATRNGLARLAIRFPERRIILLDDVPSGAALYMRDNLRRLRFDDFSELGLPMTEYAEQRSAYESILVDIADKFPNVQYRPLFQSICDERLCPLFEGQTLLYRDGDHLSWQGALKLVDTARDLLMKDVQSPASPGEAGELWLWAVPR